MREKGVCSLVENERNERGEIMILPFVQVYGWKKMMGRTMEVTRYRGRKRVGNGVGMGWLFVSYTKAKSTLHQ